MTVFEEAAKFAIDAHAGMVRRRQSVPYIVHPMEVAVICAAMTSDPEVLAAAMLHDTVEDAGIRPEEIEARFGPRVALLVASETEDKRPKLPPDQSWRIRKEESLQVLAAAEDPGVRILWLGDKLANIRSFHRAWRVSGHAIWEDFNQKDPAQQAWYYRSIVELLRPLEGFAAWQELKTDVEEIFEGV